MSCSPVHIPSIEQELSSIASDLSAFSIPSESAAALHAKNEELQAHMYRLQCDLDQSQQFCERLREELESTQRDVTTVQVREQRLTAKFDKVWDQLRKEKEEHTKLKSAFQHKENQYQHEIRKKEREMATVKDRLNKQLVDRKQNAKFGLEVVNAVKQADTSKAPWRAQQQASQESEFQRFVAQTYEDRQQQLMRENEILRRIVATTHASLADSMESLEGVISALAAEKAAELEEPLDDEGASSPSTFQIPERLPASVFELPLSANAEMLEQSAVQQLGAVSSALHLLADRIEKSGRGAGASHAAAAEAEVSEDAVMMHPTFVAVQQELDEQIRMHNTAVSEMQSQLQGLERVVEEQDKLLQESVFGKQAASPGSAAAMSYLNLQCMSDSVLLEEQEDLMEEKRRFALEKAAFEQERQHYTDAALKLSQERTLLQQERKMLERERATLESLQKNAIAASPSGKYRSPLAVKSFNRTVSTPNWLKEERKANATSVLFSEN